MRTRLTLHSSLAIWYRDAAWGLSSHLMLGCPFHFHTRRFYHYEIRLAAVEFSRRSVFGRVGLFSISVLDDFAAMAVALGKGDAEDGPAEHGFWEEVGYHREPESKIEDGRCGWVAQVFVEQKLGKH